MTILLVNETSENGMVALAEKYIVGEVAPPRTYRQQGNFLELIGKPHIIEHDAEEILRIPGWHLASAEEQNQYTSGKRKATRLREAPTQTTDEIPTSKGGQSSTAGLYESLR